jgi:hypothetical protein
MSVAVPGGVNTLSRGRMTDTFMNETMPRRVLWALLCPFVGRLRHRSLTVRVIIGKIPAPMLKGKGKDWLVDSASLFLRFYSQGLTELLRRMRT